MFPSFPRPACLFWVCFQMWLCCPYVQCDAQLAHSLTATVVFVICKVIFCMSCNFWWHCPNVLWEGLKLDMVDHRCFSCVNIRKNVVLLVDYYSSIDSSFVVVYRQVYLLFGNDVICAGRTWIAWQNGKGVNCLQGVSTNYLFLFSARYGCLT